MKRVLAIALGIGASYLACRHLAPYFRFSWIQNQWLQDGAFTTIVDILCFLMVLYFVAAILSGFLFKEEAVS